MTKPKNEAERLLNTIVSSRARLAAMRGDSVGSVEPSLETEHVAPTVEDPGVGEYRNTDDKALFADLPTDDDHTDISEPALVLGIDEPEREDISNDPWRDVPDAGVSDIPSSTPTHAAPPSAPSLDAFPEIDEHWPEAEADDPFSFIDLLPPSSSEEPSTPDASSEPLSTPPPVRDRPMMPLPVTLAACAPQQPVPTAPTPEMTTALEGADSPLSIPEPPSPPEPEPTQAVAVESLPIVVEEPTSGEALSAPRAVAPRLLDPDRPRLEVDIIVDDTLDELPLAFEANVPQLTDGMTPDTHHRAPPTPPPDATTSFDSVSEGFEALRHGNIRAATMHFSDALDWDPTQVEARLARGRCRRDLGDTAGAMSDFLLSQDYAAHSPEPHVEMGDLFFARKDYGRAIGHYDDALQIQPEHAMALCRRGISHHHIRRHSQAVEDLKQAARIDPNIPNIARYIRMASTRR